MKVNRNGGRVKKLITNRTFQRFLLCIITVVLAFAIIFTGAQPRKYKLSLGDVSVYDINTPRDIENKVLTQKNRETAYDSVQPVTKEDSMAFVKVIYKKDDFFKAVKNARINVDKKMKVLGISTSNKKYNAYLSEYQRTEVKSLSQEISELQLPLSENELSYLVTKVSDNELDSFDELTKELLTETMSEAVTDSNIAVYIQKLQNSYQNVDGLSQELKNIGGQLSKYLLKPNRIIDDDATGIKRQEAYDDPANIVKVKKDTRVISYGEIVTEDKLQMLEDLDVLDVKGSFDYLYSLGILILLLFLIILVIKFIMKYNKNVINNNKELLLISILVIITLLIARYTFPYYNGLAIPIFIGTMTISILINVELAAVINCAMTIAISLMISSDHKFLYMGLVCGVISAFLVTNVSQRGKLAINGAILGVINVLFVLCFDLLGKSDLKTIITDAIVVFSNGVLSMILTIGFLPFLETSFNMVTTFKLQELSNSNHPLLKRLLLEAPGTYHHSIMVGNLAEVATEDVGGNALLSRVGAFFHDVGKLKRPDLFIENQLGDNPHDKMPPNISTVVITSHVKDGVEIAQQYKVPIAIRSIIEQHHGNTLVAYFYHKAMKNENNPEVKSEDFRYTGPRPQSTEAAIVMLADSVEAAVRSMSRKNEEEIEAIIKKIIRDKFDDGQLDMCSLTIKDLNTISKSFLKVLSGYFHAREQYPDIKEITKSELNDIKTDAGEERNDNNRKRAK